MLMQVQRGAMSRAAVARFLPARRTAAFGLLLLVLSAGCFTRSKAREALTAEGMSELKLEKGDGGFSFTGRNRQGWSCSGFIRGKAGLFTTSTEISSQCHSVTVSPQGGGAPSVVVELPRDLRYTKNHEWLRASGDRWRVGITRFAAIRIGDVAWVELPAPGTVIRRGEQLGTIESVLAVQTLYAPVSGKVVAVNEKLRDAPELVNDDPYSGGWMVEVEPSDRSQADELLTADAYGKLIGAGE